MTNSLSVSNPRHTFGLDTHIPLERKDTPALDAEHSRSVVTARKSTTVRIMLLGIRYDCKIELDPPPLKN